MSATNQKIVLNEGGTGTFNGTAITYTVSNKTVSFTSGDYSFSLTLNDSGNLVGTVEYDYEDYSASFTKDAA